MMDKSRVLECLERYLARIEEIFAILAGRQPLPREEEARAQACMRALKADLEADYRRGARSRGREPMTAIERSTFHPAIHEAYTQIRVRWNSVPSARWIAELYDAASTLRWYLDGAKG